MPKRVELTAEQRGELVLRLLRKEAKASDLAREASIPESTLHQWRDDFLRAGIASLKGHSVSNQEAERRRHARELAQRDQVIGEMTVALKLLKKNLGVSE